MAKANTAVKEKKVSKKKRSDLAAEHLSESLLFDIDRFDDFVMSTGDPIAFRSGAGISMENFGQLKLFNTRHRFIIGVDEVGRGCLAGPVVAAAVILPGFDKSSEIASRLALLDDSKKLAASTREALSKTIRGCSQFAIGEASVEEIDTINIFHASLLAMQRAVNSLVSSAMLDLREALILIDGKWKIPGIDANQLPVIKGDTKSASIAAASVIAKVHRDAFMVKLGEEFPSYNWRANKGYACLDHRMGIQEHGMTIWHRRSFKCLPDVEDDEMLEENEDAENALKSAIRKVSKKNGGLKAKPSTKKSTDKKTNLVISKRKNIDAKKAVVKKTDTSKAGIGSADLKRAELKKATTKKGVTKNSDFDKATSKTSSGGKSLIEKTITVKSVTVKTRTRTKTNVNGSTEKTVSVETNVAMASATKLVKNGSSSPLTVKKKMK